jgi:hypothetical protein
MRVGLRVLLVCLWIGSVATAFWIGRYSVPIPPPSPAEPSVPEIAFVKEEWAGNELRRTVRNNGATGEVLITVHQGNLSWKFRTAFTAQEERQVCFDLSGVRPGQTCSIDWIPVVRATKSQLDGAILPK